jgi:virginiamycin B lyase
MIALGGLVGALKPWASPGFVEMQLPRRTDVPISIAAARDGTIWFTMERAFGRLRNGAIEKIPRRVADVEPLGLAVDAGGAAWFTDTPTRAIGRLGPDGRLHSFSLPTSIVRLGRLAVAPDGAVWFSEPSTVSVTRLRDGVFTRFMVGTPAPMGPTNAAPFGVAVDPHGSVWATLQNANQLVRIAPGSEMTTFDVPSARSGLGDVAVDTTGAVWFLEVVANKVGRYASGRFREFTVPTPSAGLMALAVAPDGAAWFTELRAHKLGRVYGDVITEFPLPRGDARPFGLAVDAANNIWYTDLDGWLGRLPADRTRG